MNLIFNPDADILIFYVVCVDDVTYFEEWIMNLNDKVDLGLTVGVARLVEEMYLCFVKAILVFF